MKSASPTLATLINSGIFVDRDLYSIELAGGGVLNLCTGDFDIIDTDSTHYSCGAPGSGLPKVDSQSARTQASIKAGLDSDSWQVYFLPLIQDPFTGAFTYPDVVGSTPWLTACRSGLFDGAVVTVKRAYFAAPPTLPLSVASRTCVGSTTEFIGYMGVIDSNNTVTVFTFTGMLGLLDQQMPRNMYQASCRHILFNAQCALSAATFVQTGSAISGSKIDMQASVAAPSGSGTFVRGSLTFTSGQNSGFTRLITNWDGVSAFNFLYPFAFAIQAGDAFNIWPGCDKSLGAQGCGGFANKANFGGNPFIPLPEITLG